MKLKKITYEFEKSFPKNISEEWDNVGVMVGEVDSDINKVQISLDITDEIIDRAISEKANLIITHHPMIFRGIKSVTDENRIGKRVINLIKNNIAVYSLHTNLDSAKEGLNQYIAEKLGMKSGKIIDGKIEKIYKLKIFIPEEGVERLIQKFKKGGFVSSDKYENCFYISNMTERYTTKEEALPSGKEEENIVKCIEFIVKASDIKRVEEIIVKNHNYEEPAYEFYETGKTVEIGGIGRVFDLEKSIEIEEFIKFVKKELNIQNIKVVFGEKKSIKKVAVVNGSGAEYISKMKRLGVDVFITGDIKYHEAQVGKENGITLMDIGHFECEVWFADIIKKFLDKMDIENYTFNGETLFKTF
jgi:dinuclear metal center YbgI/SA1388 family protein